MINEGRTFICSHCLEESPYFSLFFDGDGNECCASCYDKLPEDQKGENIGSEG